MNKNQLGQNPEIESFIYNFIQSLSQSNMMGGMPPMMGGMKPPVPPTRGMPNKAPQNRRVQQDIGARAGYASRPPQTMQPQYPPMMNQPNEMPMNQMRPNMPITSPPETFPSEMNQMNMVGGPAPMGNMMPAQPRPQAMPPMTTISEEESYARAYSELLTGQEYQTTTEDQKRIKIGDLIYSFVERKAGGENAPKITGMIIDLDLNDLEASTQPLESLNEKIDEGLVLLREEAGN